MHSPCKFFASQTKLSKSHQNLDFIIRRGKNLQLSDWLFNLSDLVWLGEKPCGEDIVISDIIWLSFSNQKKSLCSFRSVKSGICKIRRMVHAESNGVLRNESKQLPKTFKWAGCLFHITLDLSSLLTISFYRRYTL